MIANNELIIIHKIIFFSDPTVSHTRLQSATAAVANIFTVTPSRRGDFARALVLAAAVIAEL